MELTELYLVTIVSERILKDDIIQMIKDKGASGYTITDVKGEGSRGTRVSDFEGRNIKFEVVVGKDVGNKIIDSVSETYFENYAVITYASPVNVVRGDKYL
ncbi:MAG: hypothetical protein R6V27_11015 [Balneolaceae bacterium]